MIGEVIKVDVDTGTRTIPSEKDLLPLLPAAAELYSHISDRVMTREQLLGRITCFYKGFVEPVDINERLLTNTIWEASSANTPAPQ